MSECDSDVMDGGMRDLIPRKGRKRNASLTTRALNEEDSDKIRNNEHTDEGYSHVMRENTTKYLSNY